jgi:hypothetical protein
MEEDLKCLLDILHKESKNDYGEDNEKLKKLIGMLETLKTKLPTKEELDDIEKEVNYFDIKYEAFYDLGYYFGPIHAKIARDIHNEYVKKLREEMRKKRNQHRR